MKILLSLFLLTTATALAQSDSVALPPPASATPPPAAEPPAPVPSIAPGSFPGIKIVMTPEEFAKAGLSGLSDDQIGVINAAITRHYDHTIAKAATQEAEEMTQQAVAEEKQKSWLAHVGLPDVMSAQWKNEPGIKAKCTGWATGNSFKLDNDQVWEGVEPIRMELSGHDIEIQARPNGAFDLVVDGKNTTYRVIRIK